LKPSTAGSLSWPKRGRIEGRLSRKAENAAVMFLLVKLIKPKNIIILALWRDQQPELEGELLVQEITNGERKNGEEQRQCFVFDFRGTTVHECVRGL
jgi:hypothetical protein